jgi:hypothetical protein
MIQNTSGSFGAQIKAMPLEVLSMLTLDVVRHLLERREPDVGL